MEKKMYFVHEGPSFDETWKIYEVEAKTLTEAKRKASKLRVFYLSVLTVKDENNNTLSIKQDGEKWDDGSDDKGFFYVEERPCFNSQTTEKGIIAKTLTEAKRKASRNQVFQGTVLVIKDCLNNILATKEYGEKWNDRTHW